MTIENLKTLEDEIEIEYYTNSWIIKSIDGIDIFNYEQFAERLAKLKVQYIENISNEREQKEEEQKKHLEGTVCHFKVFWDMCKFMLFKGVS